MLICALPLVLAPVGRLPTVVAWFLVGYGISRVNEIAYAFYRDALSRRKSSTLTPTERIKMAMRSYFGLAFNFALLYYCLPVKGLFKEDLNGFFDAFYFSGVTLATLGYGDILPAHSVSRALALYEVFSGILLVGVAIGTYIGHANGATGPKSDGQSANSKDDSTSS